MGFAARVVALVVLGAVIVPGDLLAVRDAAAVLLLHLLLAIEEPLEGGAARLPVHVGHFELLVAIFPPAYGSALTKTLLVGFNRDLAGFSVEDGDRARVVGHRAEPAVPQDKLPVELVTGSRPVGGISRRGSSARASAVDSWPDNTAPTISVAVIRGEWICNAGPPVVIRSQSS